MLTFLNLLACVCQIYKGVSEFSALRMDWKSLVEASPHNQEHKGVVCASAELDAAWKGEWNEANFGGTGPFLQYFGDQRGGSFRFFPGGSRYCSAGKIDYDPRLRPWYSSAATGLCSPACGTMNNSPSRRSR